MQKKTQSQQLIKWQIFFQGVYEEENFHHILYNLQNNQSIKRNLLSLIIRLERNENKKNFFNFVSSYEFEDFIFRYLKLLGYLKRSNGVQTFLFNNTK